MSITTTTAFLDAVLDGSPDLNALFNGGVLEIRTGTAPGATNAATGTVLATFVPNATQWAPAANGQRGLTTTLTDASAAATGTAGYFRLRDSTGVYVVEGDCTAVGGGGDMQLITTSIVATQPIDLTAFTFLLTV